MKYLFLPLFLFLFMGSMGAPVLAQTNSQTAEYQLVNLINRQRRQLNLNPLALDRDASQVARQHSQDMQQENYFDLSSPSRGSLAAQLSYARVSGRLQHSLIAIDYDVEALFNQIKSNPALLSQDSTHLAVGITAGEHPEYGHALWATVIMLQYLAHVDDLPRTLQPSGTLRFKAVIAESYEDPRLPVTFPNGRVHTFYPSQHTGQTYFFTVPFPAEKGRYALELLLDDPSLGPRVAMILPLYVGMSYPLKDDPPPEHRSPPQFSNTRQAADYLVQQINQERLKHGLKPLKPDPLLTYVAYQHSEDMAQRQFFAHINPDGLDPNQRFQQQGGIGSVGENIAYDVSMDAAHYHLMSSPGHRANILHEAFTHVGVGVYFDGKQYYVTQLFQHKTPEVNLKQFRQGLLAWLGRLRQQNQRAALQEEPLFSQVALEHSQAMAASDQLAYRVQKLDFSERYVRRGGTYRELNTLILSAYSLDDALNKLKKHEKLLLRKNWNKLGLGVLQANSRSMGENTIWITLGIAAD